MVRSRWAVLALAISALFIAGCGNGCEEGLFSRFRFCSRNRDCECPVTDTSSHPIEGGGPVLTPSDPFLAPVPPTPPIAPPPRIVPIPHAAPMPYTPTH